MTDYWDEKILKELKEIKDAANTNQITLFEILEVLKQMAVADHGVGFFDNKSNDVQIF